MCETANMILAIIPHTCVWKVNDELFCNNNAKKMAWEKVASALYYDWETIEESTKAERTKNLQKRWRSVKMGYWRWRKKEQLFAKNETTFKPRKYAYSKLMSFMDETLEQIVDFVDNQADTSDEEGTDDLLTQTKNSPLQVTENPPVCKMEIEQETEPSAFQSELTQVDQQEADKIDEDRLFLMSCLPSLKKLSELQKLDFKIQMMKLLRNVRLQSFP